MKPDEIKNIGIMGGGVMGGGIAQVLAVAGYRVIIRDLTEELLDKTQLTITDGRFGLNAGVDRGKLTQDQKAEAMGNIRFTTSVTDLRDVDLLIEAVPENLELKRTVFAELDNLIRPEAIFATNTSGFPVSDLSQAVSRKERFGGMHWFSPVPAMKLVEVIYTPDTSEDTVACIETVGQKAGKVTVRVKDAPGRYGFIANRIYYAAVAEARKVLEEGIADADDINKAMMYGFNWPVGPLAMSAGARSGWG
jgi:3-hydroxybutyryl-CoA dehydrogenase